MVDALNGSYLSLSKQTPLKDSAVEVSVSIKRQLFAVVFIFWGGILLDIKHLGFVIVTSKYNDVLYTPQFLEDLIFIPFVYVKYV